MNSLALSTSFVVIVLETPCWGRGASDERRKKLRIDILGT